MIDRVPIVINDEIVGFRREFVHIFDMNRRSGKTTKIIDDILEDALIYDGDLQTICINTKRNEFLKNKVHSIYAEGYRHFRKSEIPYLIGQKIHMLYVDEWFCLDAEEQEFILDWCKRNRTYLNAYGTSESANELIENMRI